MNSRHQMLLAALVLAMTMSCAHAPRLPHANADMASMRAMYLQEHPDGAFNEQIVKGELSKGMNVIEVLASWGLPDRRIVGESTERDLKESWIYAVRDEHSRDVFVYELLFEDRILSQWILDKNTAAIGGVVHRELQREREPRAPIGNAFGSSSVAPKK